MQNILNVFRLAMALVPLIVETVKAVEIPGNGADKSAAVLQIVLAGLDGIAPDLAQLFGIDKLTSFINKVINIVVALLNKAGIFNTSTPKP